MPARNWIQRAHPRHHKEVGYLCVFLAAVYVVAITVVVARLIVALVW